MDTAKIQCLQKTQEGLNLARNLVEAIETNAKKDLAKDLLSRSGDNCPLDKDNQMILSQKEAEKLKADLKATQNNEKLLKEKLAKALETVNEVKAKNETQEAEIEVLKQKNESLSNNLAEKDMQILDSNTKVKIFQENLKDSQQWIDVQNSRIENYEKKIQTLTEDLKKSKRAILRCKSYFKESVNNKDQDRNTKLQIASRDGNSEDVELLLELGANINKTNKIGCTALHEAVLNGHVEIVKLLLQNEPDVGAKVRNQNTALQFAAQKGHLEITKLLLKSGADVNTKNARQWTPLHYAAYNGHSDVVLMLLKNGAMKDLKNDEGKTPLQEAEQFKKGDFSNVEELLTWYGTWGRRKHFTYCGNFGLTETHP